MLRETRGAFNFGKVVLEAIAEDKGRSAFVEFQNENLTATVEGEIVATTPDLICLVDVETFTPVTTDALKYGKRVLVVGLPCYPLWRTEAGLALVGPRYFGVDTDYIPLKSAAGEGRAMYKLGIDVGGTNTDAVLIDENLRVVADIKYPTSGDVYEASSGRCAGCWRSPAWTGARSARPCWAPPSVPTPLWSGNTWPPSAFCASARRPAWASVPWWTGPRTCRSSAPAAPWWGGGL